MRRLPLTRPTPAWPKHRLNWQDAQAALDADSENADLLAARDAAQAKIDELNQTIADNQAYLDANAPQPEETPVPEETEAPAE